MNRTSASEGVTKLSDCQVLRAFFFVFRIVFLCFVLFIFLIFALMIKIDNFNKFLLSGRHHCRIFNVSDNVIHKIVYYFKKTSIFAKNKEGGAFSHRGAPNRVKRPKCNKIVFIITDSQDRRSLDLTDTGSAA